jgi:hypothetical protein
VALDEFTLAGRYRSADGTGHVRLATAPRSRAREQFRVEITACGCGVRWRRHPDHSHPGPDTRPRAALPCHPARPSGPYDETGSTAFCMSTCRSHDVAGSSAPTWADLGLGHPDDDGPSVHQAERAARAGYDCVRVLIASSRRCSHPLRRCSPVGGRTTHACGLRCFRRWSTDFARQRRDRICEGQETTSLTSGPAVPQRLIHHNYGHDAAGFAPATGALCPSQGCRRWASTRPVSAPGTARSASPDHSTP